MSETPEHRIQRLERATNRILFHPVTSSFSDLIESHHAEFQGFRLLYATDTINSQFNGVLLSDIEPLCPALSHYFGAKGLIFFDDDIYEGLKRHGAAVFPIDYSISFDTQVAEAYSLLRTGKATLSLGRFLSVDQFCQV